MNVFLVVLHKRMRKSRVTVVNRHARAHTQLYHRGSVLAANS